MINLQTAQLIIGVITFLFAYLLAVPIAGCFRAWIANQLGDSTAKDLGFLTLNPLVHIDPVGIFFLIIFYFGWGRTVPINPLNFYYPYRTLKLLAAYLSDTFAYFVLALLGNIILVLAFGPRMLPIVHTMLTCMKHMSHLALTYTCPNMSSFSIMLAFIIVAFMYLCIMLGALNFLISCFSVGIYLFMEQTERHTTLNYYIIFIAPFILIFFFAEPLRYLAITTIARLGYAIAHLAYGV